MQIETVKAEEALSSEPLEPTVNPRVFVSPDNGSVVIIDANRETAVKVTA